VGGVAFSGEVSWPNMEKLKDTIQNSLTPAPRLEKLRLGYLAPNYMFK